MKYIFCISLYILLGSCTHKSTNDEVEKFRSEFQHDDFNILGDYHWNFQLMGSPQSSLHTFYQDSITYSMKGKVYSTDYTMQKLSYDEATQKWIGRDENQTVYVLFFKDQTDSTLTIYKHKCKEGGLAEALAFDRPGPEATDDHGWNVYKLGEDDSKDILPVRGKYTNADKEIEIADEEVTYQNKAFTKLSYHSGERRWVGQHDSTYLQIIFRDSAIDSSEIYLSVQVHDDMEEAYRIKFNEVSFLAYDK